MKGMFLYLDSNDTNCEQTVFIFIMVKNGKKMTTPGV